MKPLSVSNNFKVTAKARYDLLKIGQYTEARWGKNQRNHYLKQLDEAFKFIAVNPKIGTDRSHVIAGYRSFQQGSHVIYYKASNVIEIVRILHKQMDVGKYIQKT